MRKSEPPYLSYPMRRDIEDPSHSFNSFPNIVFRVLDDTSFCGLRETGKLCSSTTSPSSTLLLSSSPSPTRKIDSQRTSLSPYRSSNSPSPINRQSSSFTSKNQELRSGTTELVSDFRKSLSDLKDGVPTSTISQPLPRKD